MDSLNPISSYDKHWSVDSLNRRKDALILDAHKPLIYSPSDLNPWQTYTFQFTSDYPFNISADIILNGSVVPLTQLVDGNTVTVQFQVPYDYEKSSSPDKIRFSLVSGVPASVRLSGFGLGESKPIDTDDSDALMSHLLEKYPSLKKVADGTINHSEIQKVTKAISSYNKRAESYDPSAPDAQDSYKTLQAALTKIQTMELDLFAKMKSKSQDFMQKALKIQGVSNDIKKSGAAPEELAESLKLELGKLTLYMLPKQAKEAAPPVTDSAPPTQTTYTPPPSPPPPDKKKTPSPDEGAEEFALAAKCFLIDKQYLLSFLDPDDRSQLDTGRFSGSGNIEDELSALEAIMKAEENMGG